MIIAEHVEGAENPAMAASSDMFNPTHYANVLRKVSEASHLPSWCYSAPDFYSREIERVFRKAWNFIGRADRVVKPGDFFTVDLAGTPIIVLRDRATHLRAFANTCRHRGARLLSGTGHCSGNI